VFRFLFLSAFTTMLQKFACYLRHASSLSVRLYACNNSRTLGGFLWNLILGCFTMQPSLSTSSSCGQNCQAITGTLHEGLHVFLRAEVTFKCVENPQTYPHATHVGNPPWWRIAYPDRQQITRSHKRHDLRQLWRHWVPFTNVNWRTAHNQLRYL
jgi:hypothetical protein